MDSIKYQYILIIVTISRGEGYGNLQDPRRFIPIAYERECPNLVDAWQLALGNGMGWIDAGEDLRLTCSGTVSKQRTSHDFKD